MPRPPTETRPLPGALEPAWHADGTPFSPEFADVYYSRDSGLAESRHVFVEGNGLAARWRALAPDALFTVGETGFGTGLNFLLAWQTWRACAPDGARLLFRSLDAFPLSRGALGRALACWPELEPLSSTLRAAWPPALSGLHTLGFDDDRVTLQLFVGDVEDALTEFVESCDPPVVDAWFLDGFAPARNPRMWSPAVLARIGALTRHRGSFATFSAAAAVRDGLSGAGFEVSKTAGFGRKRDMLRGERTKESAAVPRVASTPWHRAATASTLAREVIVVGAGIAGCTTARALARRGWSVTVLEAASEVAQGASGNPQAILFTQLPAGDSAHGEFTLASYLHALRCYADLLGDEPSSHSACGLLQLYGVTGQAQFLKLQQRYAELPELARALDRADASRHAGLALSAGGLLLPASGWVDPRAACRAALAAPGIRVHYDQQIESLRRTDGGWRLQASSGADWEAPVVVLANARAANALLPGATLPLEAVRGQVTLLPAWLLPAAPRCVVCAEGYLIPPLDGSLCCGASFVRGAAADEPSADEQGENLRRIAEITPDFDPSTTDPGLLRDRVGERCATPDRLPIVGRVPDEAAFNTTYAALRANARRVVPARGPCLPGLLVNVGHGSRGMCSAPLAAELLAAELTSEPLPVTRRVARALSPARFLLRTIVRGPSP